MRRRRCASGFASSAACRTASHVLALALVASCGGDKGGDDGNGDGGADGSGAATTVTLTLGGRPTDAAMFTFVVAYQDGDSAWQVAPAPSGDSYSLLVHGSMYAIAWTCVANALTPQGVEQLRQVVIARFAVAERTTVTFSVPPRCTDRDMPVALMGNVANLTGGGEFFTAFDDRAGLVNANNGNYQLMTAAGSHDLMILRMQTGVMTGERVIDRAAIQRGVTAPGTQNIDFATSAATQSFPVSITTTGRATATTTLYTAGNATSADLVRLTSTPYESRALAASQTIAGDLYDQTISVAGGGAVAARSVFTSTPAAQTWAPPTPFGGAITTVAATTPYPQISAMWGVYANASGYTVQVTQPLTMAQCATTTSCVVSWSALISPGAAGAMPSYQMPDLSALAGWSTTLQPISGAMINGFVQAHSSSGGVMDFPPVSPAADGTVRAIARSDYTAMP